MHIYERSKDWVARERIPLFSNVSRRKIDKNFKFFQILVAVASNKFQPKLDQWVDETIENPSRSLVPE